MAIHDAAGLPVFKRPMPPDRLCNLGRLLEVPGDDRTRSWPEEIFLVTPSGGDPFFTWGHQPIAGVTG
jgi:hypothetical protein